jgi:class 3 adenylate cyclase
MEGIEIRTLVMLMTDAHRFAMIGNELERRGRLADFIQAYYEMVGAEVKKNGGRLVKYIGDGSLSVFEPKDASAAVRCGHALRAGYAALADGWKLGIETELEVGISAGPVSAGIFGHESLRCYDVFGEAVNEAAMITHHRGVAVTGAAKKLLEGQVRTARLEDRILKWRPEPLEVWEALA